MLRSFTPPNTPTGSGTPNTIPKWDTTTTLNDSVITQSGSNIGIGVAIPTAPLHAFGTSTTIAATTTASSGILRIEGSATNKLFVGSFVDGSFGMYAQTNHAAYPISLQPAGGNVGIGTASPLTRLDVAGSGRITGTASSILTGTADPTASTTLVGTGTAFSTELVVGDRITVNAETRTVTAIASNISLTVDSAFTDTAPASITRLSAVLVTRLSSNAVGLVQNDLGKVGIGVANPSSALHLRSDSQYAFQVAQPTTTSGASGYFTNATNTLYVGVENSTGSAIGSTVSYSGIVSSQGAYPLVLMTNALPRMTILSAGNVGIGTTSPTTNLQVVQGTAGIGTVSNSASGTTVTGVGTQFLNTFKPGDTVTIVGQTVVISAIASDTSMTTAAITNANTAVAYTLVGGTRFSVLGNGNVGIGMTPSMVHRLDVAGRIGGSIFGDGYLEFLSSGNTALRANNTVNIGYTDAINVTNTGLVGIGTTSPTGHLHVVGGTAEAATNGAPVTIIAQNAGTGNQNGGNIVLTPGAPSGIGLAGVADLSGPTGTGLKLPATPGNSDVQTLDCYQESPYTATDTSGAGLAFVINNPAVCTRVGRLVFMRVDITYPATIDTSYASISFPFTSITNGGTAAAYGGTLGTCLIIANGAAFEVYASAPATQQTNANLSGVRLAFSICFQAS